MFVDGEAVGGAAVHGAHAAGRAVEVLDEARHTLVLLLRVPQPPEPAEAPAVRALLRIYRHLPEHSFLKLLKCFWE